MRPAPRALCFGHPQIDLWFSNAWTAKGRADQERAIAVCRVCPVRRDCLNAAKGRCEKYGIWGGEVFG